MSSRPPAPGGAVPPGAPEDGGTSHRVTIDALGLASAQEPAAKEGSNAFLYACFQLFKTAQIHAIDNQALRRPLQNFVDAVARLISREGRISFQSKDGALFLNGAKLRLSTEEYALAYDIFDFFKERGMGGFVIEEALDPEKVHRLLRVLVYAPAAERRFAPVEAALRDSQLPFHINRPLGTRAKGTGEVVLERRSYTFLSYSKLVVLYRSLLAEESSQGARRQFLMKKITRTVQALVDICLEDDHTFLGVSSVKSGEAYAPHHAANTAVLSIVLGEKLGLPKVDLADLGLAGVFCDVGLKLLPRAVAEKQGPLDAAERALVEQHPLRGVEYMLGEGAFTRSTLSRIVVAFEHHRRTDGGGYPPMARPPDLFSRIVAIAEAYDALTTDRPWRKAYLPDEALAVMLGESGRRFDPVLLKVFVNTMGLYPVGTLVRLDSGEMAVVVYGGGDAERLTRPVVALLGPDGRPGQTVDLAARDGAGAYLRSIVHSEDPAKYGLQSSGLFAESTPA